ncbi:MAG: hypothetical protein IJV98_02490 [Clostridia bacterium]|nr:hypothetical protein [Clostridia bacterium]
MDTKNKQQNTVLIRQTKNYAILLLGFIFLFFWFGIRLVSAESPDEWKEAYITVDDVRYVSGKHNRWEITDIDGNVYSSYSYTVMSKIHPQNTYHIVYSLKFHNAIRAISQGDTVILDYAHSVSVYSERSVWDWLLMLVGIAGSVTTITFMIMNIRKNIAQYELRQKDDETFFK